ncbi:alpha/beta fold hydrolase [Nonomuraea sp. NPDC046802]|uniref:alpha/beta fold hydrolase n=1 Tax=Nonomuraea sp. NPDC046802 TaxID=3154919 RepID=UPI0033CA3398
MKTSRCSARERISSVLAAGAALAAMLLPAVPAAASQPVVPSHECAAAKDRCDGTLSVPLNWSDPSSERITVAFAWLPATKRPGRATGTILANPGGPLAALPALAHIQQALGPVLEDQNLLVVEPRGLGASSPLLCPGLNLTAPETIAPCARHLGPRIRFFTADQAVQDMDAVRQALGVPKVSFYGNSYGTLFAQAYAARHPSSLAAAFLDSTVITSADGYALWPDRSRLDQLDLVCGQSRACRALPGRASSTWADLVTRLRAHPDPKVPIAALRTVDLQVFDPVFGREANAAAAAYLRGDPAPLRRLTQVLPGQPQQPPESPEWAGFLAYRCGDGSFPFDRDASPAERQAQLRRHFLQERPLAPYTPADLGRDITKDLDFCVRWPTPRHSPPLPPRANLPSVPIMVVGGDFDTQSPDEVARALRAFPRATFVRVPFAAHGLAQTPGEMGECVRKAMQTFLTNHQIPDVRCTAENYRAIGSFPRTISDVAPIPATGLSPEQQRLLAVTFATAADAVARRNPYSFTHSRLDTQPGLRGGQVRFGDATITLEQVSLVRGLKVSGQIAVPSNGQAAATLQVSTGDGQPHRITLAWQPFTPHERPALSGVVDDTPFTMPNSP